MSTSKVSRRRVAPLASALAVLSLLVAAVSCATAARGESSLQVPTISLASTVSLESTIELEMQGIQLDVWGGGAPAPGGTTTMFVHHGRRAAEVYWTTDGWCVARLFTWSVERALSANQFTVHYVAYRRFAGCVVQSDDQLDLQVYDTMPVNGRRTLLGAYPDLDGTWTERTVCSTRWDDSSPCGFPDAARAAAHWV